MKKRIFMLVFALFFLTACGRSELGYEIGSIRLIADGVEHEPYIHLLHAGFHIDGSPVIASGHPAAIWLEENLSTMRRIPYSDDLQLFLTGRHGQVNTGFRRMETELEGMEVVAIRDEDFVRRGADVWRANVSLPDEAGIYLVFVDVQWSGRGTDFQDFTANRYLFKIERDVSP